MKRITFWVLTFALFTALAFPVFACEDHFFFRVGAGKNGDWLTKKSSSDWIGEEGIAADISLGYRQPIKSWLWWDITAQHKSQWNRGWPLNDKYEDELDSVILGIEFRY